MAQQIVLSGSLIFNQDGTEVGRITPEGSVLQVSSSLNISGSLILDGQDVESRLDTLEAGQSGDELTFGNLLSWTGSTDSRLYSIEQTTGSLNSFTGSYNTGSFSGSFTGSFNGDGTLITGVISSSYAISASSIEWDNVENKPTGIISRSAQISNLGFISGSPELEATASLHESRLDTLETKTGSLDSEQTTQDARLSSLETKTGSLNTEQATQDSRLASLELETGSITTEQATQDSRLSNLETKTGSLDSEQTLQDSRLASLETESGSIDGRVTTLESSDTLQDSRLSTLETKTGSLDTEQTLQDSRLATLETKTGSLDTEQTLQDSRLSTLETKTGSLDTEQTLQDSRLATLETKTGSLDTLNSKNLLSSSFGLGGGQIAGIGGETYDPGAGINSDTLAIGGTTTSGILSLKRGANDEIILYEFNNQAIFQVLANSTIKFIPNGDTAAAVNINLTGSLIPQTDVTQDLGSPTNRWRDLYLSSGSLLIGPTTVSTNDSGDLTITDSTSSEPVNIVTGTVIISSGSTAITMSVDENGNLSTIDNTGNPPSYIDMNATGSFSGSFAGDGSQLNNLPPYIINSKAGTIPSESFSGTTLASASVTFGTAFNTSNYSVTATVNSAGNIGDLGDTSVISKTSSGFTVALGAGVSTLATFTDATVDYLAVAYGETAVTTTFAETAATASYVEYSNVVSKPTLVSSSAQLAADISGSLSKEHLSSKVPGIISQSSQITVGGDLSGTANNAILTTQAISGKTELASGLANTDEFLVNDDGTLKKMDASVFISYIESSLNAQSITLNPAAIYDSSGTPVLRSGITQGELHTALGVDPAGTINFDDTTINSRLASIETKTGSLEGDDTLVDGRLDSLETKTGSLDSEQTIQDLRLDALELETGSIDSRLDSIEAASGSYALEANVSGAFFAPSSSFSTRVTSLETNTAYLTGSQTFTGLKTFDAGLKLNDNDDLTLGTGNDYLVDFDGTNLVIHQNIAAGNDVIITNTADTTQFTFDVSAGAFTATGDITAFSDEKLKKDIVTIENALDKTNQLRGVEFTRISDDSRSIGVVAQEFEKVIPELVKTDDEGTKSVNYGQITGLLIEAIKELSAKVEDLENKLASK